MIILLKLLVKYKSNEGNSFVQSRQKTLCKQMGLTLQLPAENTAKMLSGDIFFCSLFCFNNSRIHAPIQDFLSGGGMCVCVWGGGGSPGPTDRKSIDVFFSFFMSFKMFGPQLNGLFQGKL